MTGRCHLEQSTRSTTGQPSRRAGRAPLPAAARLAIPPTVADGLWPSLEAIEGGAGAAGQRVQRPQPEARLWDETQFAVDWALGDA